MRTKIANMQYIVSPLGVRGLMGKKQNISIQDNNNVQVLNTQALAQGVYIVLIEQPNGNKSQHKLIIN